MKISPCSKHYITLHFSYDLLHILACQKNFISFLLQFVQGSAHICHRLPGLLNILMILLLSDLRMHKGLRKEFMISAPGEMYFVLVIIFLYVKSLFKEAQVADKWQDTVYVVVSQPDPDIPVYCVRPDSHSG